MPLVDKDAIYLRRNLDILFIALNPPEQSNNNGHYFSGNQSTFFKQLYLSGLINEELDKTVADKLVFGENKSNYKNKSYGIIDLVPKLAETNGGLVQVKNEDVALMIERIIKFKPKIVCILHSKIMKSFARFTRIDLIYGYNGKLFDNSDTLFFCNYFPNGNNISSDRKVNIFKEIREKL